jgi:hypothetical protein
MAHDPFKPRRMAVITMRSFPPATGAEADSSAGLFQSVHVVGSDRAIEAFECQRSYRLGLSQIPNRHQHARGDEDLTWAGRAAETGGEVRHRADCPVVPVPLEPDGADGGVALGDPYPEVEIVTELSPLPHQFGDTVAHTPQEADRGGTSEPNASAGSNSADNTALVLISPICLVSSGGLIIELDGGQHAEHQEQDAARTAYLTAQGYRVIRFWNERVNRALDDVLEAIYAGLTDS